MAVKEFYRRQNAEHVIQELDGNMSREQILLVADANGYNPGVRLAKLTGGADVGKWTKYVPGGANGAGTLKGVLMDGLKPSTAAQRGVAHVRICRLNAKKMDNGTLTAQQIADANAALVGMGSDGMGIVLCEY